MSNRKTIRTNIIKRICRRVKRNGGILELTNVNGVKLFVEPGETQRTTKVSFYYPSYDKWVMIEFNNLDTYFLFCLDVQSRYEEREKRKAK